MAAASQPTAIADLRRALERIDSRSRVQRAIVPFGVSEIDKRLPGGGLERGHLHEVSDGGSSASYAVVATLFAAGIVARMPGPVLWCLKGRDLFAPALARVGLHPDRVIYCETWKDSDVLPAMEEGLRCAGLAGVVGEVTRLGLTASRRLQLCAGESGVTAIALRRYRTINEKHLLKEPNAAATRWRVSPAPSLDGAFDHVERQRWFLELLRVKGGEPHSWTVGACDASGRLDIFETMAERPLAAKEPQRAGAG